MASFATGMSDHSSSRTRRILLQSGVGLVSRLGAVAATLAATPLMLALLGEKQLGAWLVLLSVFQWVTMFDLGIAAGARNEIARAVAVCDELRVRQTVTTGWLYVAVISLMLFMVAAGILALTPLSDWLEQRVFKGVDITITLWLIVGGACITFALNFVQSAFAAMERASAFSLFSLVVNVGFLLLLVLAHFWSINSMASIAIMYFVAMLCGNVWLILQFRRSFPQFIPDRHSVDHTLSGIIVNFGLRLFIIQLAALVIFTTSRLLTSAWLGPESVVIYDAGLKVFTIVTMVHSLLMSTIWSSFTQAFERREFTWIRQTLRRLAVLMVPLIVACVVLAIYSPGIVRLWLGDAQVGSSSLYALLAATTILSCWSNIYAYLLNGVGETRMQLISAVISGVINIPSTYLFTVTLGFGLTGIVLGTLVSLLPFSILGPYSVRKLLREHEKVL